MSKAPTSVHLHVHSEYSLLDGQCNIKKLVKRAAELEQPAIGLTDHGVMSGSLELYKAAKAEGIKPVIGCELYIVDDHLQREGKPNRTHLTVLAENQKGYQNLLKLSSMGFSDGYYRGKPGVDLKQLEDHGEGLIVMTGCLASQVCRALNDDQFDIATQAVDNLAQAVGVDNLYFEVQKNGIDIQDKCNIGIAELAKIYKRPLVATADVHYLRKSDFQTHQCLLCVQTQSTVENPKMSFSTNEFYVKDNDEMARDFVDQPEAIASTVEIAERCNVDIPTKLKLLPRFLAEGEDEPQYLRQKVMDGIRARYGDPIPGDAIERVEMELGVINRMGYDAYFLIVWDFVKWAKDRDIPVGPGRGSAAGSIVAYALGITDLDPLKHGLLFERFLNPDRVSMPDIDIDFSVKGREEVIQYVTDKYGRERVAQIITFGRMLPRNATRDSARVLGYDYQTGDKLSKLVPDPIQGRTPPLEDCLKEGTELREAYDSDPVAKRVLDTALGMEGTVRNAGVHAAAVVISDRDLTEILPMQVMDAKKLDENGKKTYKAVTQFDMKPVEEIGLLKMDFLGLRNLDVIQETVQLIEKSQGKKIDIETIPLDDKATYEMLSRGDAVGVFQLESEGIRKCLADVRPTEFDDLIAVISLYRPGAMASIPDYARGKQDPSSVDIPDERLAPILRPTNGVIIYQEQSMQIARTLAGFTPGQADDLRKAIGKKDREKMAGLESIFREGCTKSGTNSQVIDRLWSTNEASASYSFNKSHAACYAMVSYRTAWLKANYPAEFMAAQLSSVMDTKDKVPFFIATCEQMGLSVLPPDVNRSYHGFTVDNGAIRFGLEAVKGVGHGAVEEIIRAREEGGPFTSVWDFCERVSQKRSNSKTVEALIRCGAFSSTGDSRKGMLAVMEDAQSSAKRVQSDAEAGQGSIFDLAFDGGVESSEQGGNAVIHPPVPEEEFERRELLAMEKETIGLFLSDHPLKPLKDALATKTDCDLVDLPLRQHDSWIKCGGMVSELRRVTTKKGDMMLRGVVEDTTGQVDLVIFPKRALEFEPLLTVDEVVVVSGRLDVENSARPQLLVNKVTPFNPSEKEKADAEGASQKRAEERAATAAPSEVYFDVLAAAVNGSTLARLDELLQDNPGNSSVVLNVITAKGPRALILSDKYRVKPSKSLDAEIERIFAGLVFSFLPPCRRQATC